MMPNEIQAIARAIDFGAWQASASPSRMTREQAISLTRTNIAVGVAEALRDTGFDRENFLAACGVKIWSPDAHDQQRADDDGMATTRQRIQADTAVRSTRRYLQTWDVSGPGAARQIGRERPLTGKVIGHDPDLDLPLVRWEDGRDIEAVEDDEFEVIA